MIRLVYVSYLSILLAHLFLPQTCAQHAPVKYKDVGNLVEYSHIQTWSLFQDSQGLIWIGTQNGLECWDGSQLRSYPYSFPFDSLSLPSQTLWSITEDAQNRLWIGDGLTNGLIKFDMESELFSISHITEEPLSWLPTQVKFDPSGFLWVGGRDGLHRYYPETDSFHLVKLVLPGDGEKKIQIRSIEFDTSGTVWVTDQFMHLYYYDKDQQVLKPQRFKNQDIPHNYGNAFKMSLDENGMFWILGTQSELIRFNPYERTIELVKSGDSESMSWLTDGGIEVDRLGGIWYGMGKGLMHYDPLTRECTALENSDRPNLIRDILEDNQGNILVATWEGVKIVNKRASGIKIHSAFKDYLTKEESWIRELVRQNHYYWIRTYQKGLIRYNTLNGETKIYRKGELPGSLASDHVLRLLKDRDGKVWLVTNSNHLQWYNPEKDLFEELPFNLWPFISEDREGNFWSFSFNGLQRFDPLNKDTVNMNFREKTPHFGSSFDFYSCDLDQEGNLWVGGTAGLFRIHMENRSWIRYANDKGDPNSFPDNEVQSIFCDHKNRIWAGTTIGLYELHRHAGSDSLSYHKILYEGKALGSINKITADDRGNIWVATYTGLFCIDHENRVEHYTYRDGLPENPQNILLLDRDDDGHMLAGMYDLIDISPAFLEPNTFIPPVLLTDFRMNGKRILPGKESVLKKSMRFTDRIDLESDQNFFRVDFAALNYEDPERNQYRYLMQGVDKDTIQLKGKTYAEYTDLAPGKYTFWVTGSNNTGLWNTVGKSVVIRIHPPWYRSAVAYGIYGLLFILLLLGIIRVRTYRLHQEKTHLEAQVRTRTREISLKNQQILELDTLKTRFFNNISHEFRTLVTMVKAPAETLLEEEKVSHKGHQGLELIYRNANRLLKLVSQLLDISRIDKKSMKLNLSGENIFDLTHAIAVSFTPLAEVRGILYEHYLPRTDALEWIDADKLEKILNNLLSNAFKFTDEGGQVRLDISKINLAPEKSDQLEISVSDTGKGIPQEEQKKVFDRFYQAESNLKKEGGGTGIGLALTRDLVELMHGTIALESEAGMGSTFTITIPVGLDHLAEDEYSIIESSQYATRDLADIPMIAPVHEAEFPATSSKKNKKPVLLVVEDNADIRWLITSTLNKEFHVIEAVDGSAGQKLAIEHMPELVITDLMMPRMDGYELCRKLKTELRTSHVPIIMLTAKAGLEEKMLGLETGADDYITKPFETKEILVRSRNLIEQRRTLREKFSREITLDPMDIVITSTDEKFIKKAMEVIEKHMSNEEFDVARLSAEMNMSQSTLFRKLGALTNQSPVEFIRTLRLKRAALMLKEQYGNVSEVALEVGFSNPSYFAKMFKKAFAISPSEFAKA